MAKNIENRMEKGMATMRNLLIEVAGIMVVVPGVKEIEPTNSERRKQE